MTKTKLQIFIDKIVMLMPYEIKHKTVEKYLYCIYKILIDEIKETGKATVPNVGTFTLKTKEAQCKKAGTFNDGDYQYIYIDTKYKITFEPTKYLIDCISKDANPNILLLPKKRVVNKKYKTRKTAREQSEQMLATMLNMAHNNQNKAQNDVTEMNDDE